MTSTPDDLELLRSSIEHLPAGLMLFRSVRDADGRIIDFEWLLANHRAAAHVGREPDELRGKRLLEELPSHRSDGLFERYARVVETGEADEDEIHYTHDGIEARFVYRSRKVDDGFLVLFRELTDRRLLERMRRDRWSFVRDLFMQAPFAIAVVHGPEHRFVLANPEYERIIGRREIIGKSMREVFPELRASSGILRMLNSVRETGEPFTAREYEADIDLDGDGLLERRYFQFSCSPVRDDNGISSIQIVAVDVSDQVRCRQRAEAMADALEGNQRRFQATFDNAAVGIAHLSPRGKVLRFNDRVADMLGYSREELRHVRFEDISPPDDLARDFGHAQKVLRGEIPSYQVERRYIRKDGELIWANLTVSLVRDDDDQPLFFVAVIEDITERKAAESALLEADRQKDEFLAMLSHELRNPLAAIRSACALLEEVESLDPIMSRIQNILARQTSHMAHLLDELLDLARVTCGKLTIVPGLVDLRDVAREVASDLTPADGRPRLSVELPDEPVWIDGDRVRLAQVIQNLLSNALKYTPAEGAIDLRLRSEDETATLTVTDTGVGLDEEFADRLFEPFQQAPQDIARSSGGLGLGLALSKSIVEAHRGSIVARSAGRGLGSEFEARLPMTEGLRPKPPMPTPPNSTSARVMIVEDNEDAAELLAALLRARRYEVELATRGEDALALIRGWRPDAVICDIGLPDIDGYTVARTIRADPELADVKLVALSGYGQAKDRVRAEEAGFDRHLTKPAAIDAVVRALAGG